MSTSFGGTEETGDDFIDSFQIPVRFAGPYVEHTRRKTDVSRGLRNVLHVEKWSTGKELGRGGFGIVHLETEGNGSVRAVKEVPKRTGRTKTMDHLREVLAMAHFSKEEAFFVTLQAWFQSDSHIYIAMEYFPNGDLCNCVSTALPEVEVQTIAHQLTEALESMHQRKFTHRDLKPSNVFVVSTGPRWWVKLGDFGVSKRVKNDSTSMHTSIETDYTAPEITGHLNMGDEASCYTSAVDMWSLGCLVHWLLTGELPLSRRHLMLYCMEKIPFPQESLNAHQSSQLASDFVSKLMQPHPQSRLTASDALKHEWPRDVLPDVEMDEAPDLPLENGGDSDFGPSSTKAWFDDRGPRNPLNDSEPPPDSLHRESGKSSNQTFNSLVLWSDSNPRPLKRRELKKDGIHRWILKRKIRQMLGNKASIFNETRESYVYLARRPFTGNRIQDLKQLSALYGPREVSGPLYIVKRQDPDPRIEEDVRDRFSEKSEIAERLKSKEFEGMMNQYFLDGSGIDWRVIQRNIKAYLGPNAFVTPGTFRGVGGYIITAARPFTYEMVSEMQEKSK